MAYPGSAVGPPVPPARGYYGHLDPEPPAQVVRVKKKGRIRSGATLFLSLVVTGIAAIAVRGFLAGLDDPTVGDCVSTPGNTRLEVVACASAEAQFRIVGVEDDSRTAEEVQAATGLCAGFPAATTYVWEPGYRSDYGTVYCAEQL